MNNLRYFLPFSIFLLAGCIEQTAAGPTQTESRSVELGDVDSVEVDINMDVGELNLSGGAANLLDAEFSYSIEAWRPQLIFEQRGSRGELRVFQPDATTQRIDREGFEYRWSIMLHDNIPMALNVDLGVGESSLNLGGLTLQNLTVNTGVGETTIDLTGDWSQDLEVTIHGGIGETIIYLPENVGLRVEASTGIGSLVVNGLQKEGGDVYTNAAYAESGVAIELNVEGGIGGITVEVGR